MTTQRHVNRLVTADHNQAEVQPSGELRDLGTRRPSTGLVAFAPPATPVPSLTTSSPDSELEDESPFLLLAVDLDQRQNLQQP